MLALPFVLCVKMADNIGGINEVKKRRETEDGMFVHGIKIVRGTNV